MHVGDKGVVKACCVANIPFGNINEESLEDIWQGEAIKALRAKFKTGQADKRCAKCIHVEKAEGISMRQETFEKYDAVSIDELSQPFYFDIRFSNVCNFKCRTCWHGASSKWFQDAKALGRTAAPKAIIKNIKDFDQFIDKTGSALKHAKEIYIAGGEPMVTEEHFILLDWLIQNGNTQVLLRYNTNFSTLKFKKWNVLDLWSQFENVELMISLDDQEKRGEYIRSELNWPLILENRKSIRSLTHVKVKVSPTVSVFNMQTLPDFYKHLLDIDFIAATEIYLNLLERPHYYNVQIFAKEEKESIQLKYHSFFNWLDDEGIDSAVKKQFQTCLNYMMDKDQSKYWPQFISETAKLDELRKESFRSL